ncbi:MAG TPA: branched-chain amino acid ABC transporter substrate-binding protein [Candidatus Limnocylindrales bacterium]|nr:branched-chain amino acid ABC transporter substrate-binding protein [Candidatus Limnocylindrales bacterium]
MRSTRLTAIASTAVLVFAACTSGGGTATTAPATAAASGSPAAGGSSEPAGSPAGGGDKGTLKIAIELPFQGADKAASDPIKNGIRLAIKQAGGVAGGWTIVNTDADVYDDGLNGSYDPQTGANNMTKIVSDADVVAVVGPLNSAVARAEIPISNEGGLLQCSPANTATDLTKPPDSAKYRPSGKPNNYIRVVTTDDIQGPAAAQYAYETLGKKSVYIIDDTTAFGKPVADNFEKEFKARGGTVVKHDAAPKTTQDYVSIMTGAKALNPESIYYGGVTSTGGARILLAAQQAGLGDVPFIGPDGINDGSGATKDSFLNLGGPAAKNAYSTLAGPGTFDQKDKFDADYKAEYGIDATGYAGQGFACTQVILDAMNRAAPADKASAREALRAAATATDHTYNLIVGDVTFDANGDTSQHIVSIYKFDAAGAGGKGDWKFDTQVEYKSQ